MQIFGAGNAHRLREASLELRRRKNLFWRMIMNNRFQVTAEKRSMVIKRTALAFLILSNLIAIPFVRMRAQSNETASRIESMAQELGAQFPGGDLIELLRKLRSEQLEGSWAVTVTPALAPGAPSAPSFHAYGTFARSGAMVGSDRQRPLSKRHGAWTHVRGNEFAWTTIEDLFDATGKFAGTVKVRVRAYLIGKDELVGVSNGEFRDAAGNVTSSGCGTVKGERIKVEALPPECQNITPPQ
jgi:hypothetical protein